LIPPVILLLAAVPAEAQELVALSPEDSAMVERAMRPPARIDPSCVGSGDEILVCGRRLGGRGQRMQFEREPGEIVRHINEPGSGVAALAAGGCTRLCDVGVKVDLIAAARAVPKIVRHILGHD
jgi:hypothetical protein